MYQLMSSQIRGLGAGNFASIYCPDVVKRSCVSPIVKSEARTRCQQGTRWSSNRDCNVPESSEISDLDKGHFSPCTVANQIPVCGGEDEGGGDGGGSFEEHKSMYIVGGILGVLVIGGVAYAVLRKKKNKGKR
jgi:hypothetical protein